MQDYCAICGKPGWKHPFADTYQHKFESALDKEPADVDL